MNLLRVENFLLFFSLRCGALTILWSVMLSFFYILIVLLWSLMTKSSDHVVTGFLIYIIIVLFVGEVNAVVALIFFPAPNTVYSPNSITAKSLKYFAWYLGCAVVTFLVIFSLSTVTLLSERKYSTYVAPSYILNNFVAIPFLVTAAIFHLIAVIYTFRLSILSNKNLDEIKCP